MDARIVIGSFLYNPFLWLAIGIAYWAIAHGTDRNKRRIVVAVCLFVLLASRQMVMSAAMMRDYCDSVSGWFAFLVGCW